MQRIRQLELPHNHAGDVDWNTLGKILTAHILGEVLCASYVDTKYGKQVQDFQPDTDWEVYYEEKEVVVLRKILKDSPINVFMGRGVVDLPIEQVVEFLEDHERRKEWDKYLSDIKVLKHISDTDFIIRIQLEAKQCLIKQHRELLLYERMAYTDGKYVRTTVSVDLPEFPPTKGIPRSEVKPGTGFVCEPYEGRKDRTLVTHMAHIDLEGLPVVIINQAMKRHPMCVYYIREALTGSRRKKKSESALPPLTKGEEAAALNGSESLFTGNDRFSRSYAYGEEVPVSDFLVSHPEQKQQPDSVVIVPIDRHTLESYRHDPPTDCQTEGSDQTAHGDHDGILKSSNRIL